MKVKRCSRCYFRKPVSYFHARDKGPDGTPRSYQSRCKPCMREVNREVNGHRPRPPAMTHAERLARKRARYAARMAELSADAQALAEWREYIRVKEKLRREKHGAKPYPPRRRWRDGRHVAGAYVPRNAIRPSERLDPKPFTRYLDSAFPGWTVETIAGVVGVEPAHLEEWVAGGRTVTLDAMDRALTQGLGRPDLLNVLYPVEVAA